MNAVDNEVIEGLWLSLDEAGGVAAGGGHAEQRGGALPGGLGLREGPLVRLLRLGLGD